MRVLTKPTDALKDKLFFRCSPEMTEKLKRKATKQSVSYAQVIRTAIAKDLLEGKDE